MKTCTNYYFHSSFICILFSFFFLWLWETFDPLIYPCIFFLSFFSTLFVPFICLTFFSRVVGLRVNRVSIMRYRRRKNNFSKKSFRYLYELLMVRFEIYVNLKENDTNIISSVLKFGRMGCICLYSRQSCSEWPCGSPMRFWACDHICGLNMRTENAQMLSEFDNLNVF